MKNRKFGFPTDRKLAHRVRERIRWDKRVSTSDFQVIVTNGHITLMGSVDSLARKRAAVEVVNNTEGVLSVEDQVLVPSCFHRPDSELKRLVEEQIVESGIGPSEHVSVAVEDGHVKLEGVVHSAEKKAQAAGIVWELSGVADCMNTIEIVDPPQPTLRVANEPTAKRLLGGNDFLSCRTRRIAI